jgi:O-antigen biosynthesis protein
MNMEKRRALICFPIMPEFDREGGSRRVFHLLEFFQQAGWNVGFAAENAQGGERYARVLQQMGIPVYAFHHTWTGGHDSVIKADELFATTRFDLVVFGFWNFAEVYTPLVRRVSPSTQIVVDSIDLHFLRQARRVFCSPQRNGHRPALDQNYAWEMRRELNVYASADAVLTVSQKEAGLINDLIGRPLAYSIPDREDVIASAMPPQDRKGMLFVGNFRHPPNAQAVEYLCSEILPKVPAAVLEEHPVYIVGNDPTEAVVKCCREAKSARLVGWVPSVLPYLQRVRLSLIPLLYGAGTKRKLMQSLMAGTPAVSTSIGIEGFDLQHERHVLVADDAAAFAGSITALMTDADLWQRLADEGQRFIKAVHSSEMVFARFKEVLSRIAN